MKRSDYLLKTKLPKSNTQESSKRSERLLKTPISTTVTVSGNDGKKYDIPKSTVSSALDNMRKNTSGLRALDTQYRANQARDKAVESATLDYIENAYKISPDEHETNMAELRALEERDKIETEKWKRGEKVDYEGFTPSKELPFANRKALVEYQKTRRPAQVLIKEKQDAMKERAELDNYASFLSARHNPDFAELSKYKSTENEGVEPNIVAGVFTNLDDMFGDLEYELINQNPRAIEKNNEFYAMAGTSSRYTPDDWKNYFGDEEIALYNYFYKTDKNKAEKFKEAVMSGALARRREALDKEAYQFAQENPIGASFASVLTAPMSDIPAALMQTLDYFDDGEIQKNAIYNTGLYQKNALRGGVQDVIRENAGDFWAGAYGVGMSIADNAFVGAMSGGSGALAASLMSTSAYANTVAEARDKGLSSDQAMTLGVIAGASEYVTENIGFDKIFNAMDGGGKKAVVSALISNGLEEMSSGTINTIADIIVSADKSEWLARINRYKELGYSDSVAFSKALWDVMGEIGLEGVAGMASAGVMIAPSVAMNSYAGYAQGKEFRSDEYSAEDMQSIIQVGLAMNKNGESYRLATELQAKLDAGNPVSWTEYGKLYNEVSSELGFDLPIAKSRKASPESTTEKSSDTETAPATEGVAEIAKNTTEAPATTEASTTVHEMKTSADKAVVSEATTATQRLASTLGENGEKAFNNAIPDATADEFRAFVTIYGNELEPGKTSAEALVEAKSILSPEAVIAAENSGKNDALKAEQAVYFGEDAGLVRNEALGKMRLKRSEERKLDAIGKIAKAKVEMVDELFDENGKHVNAEYVDGVLRISSKVEDPVQTAITHEVVHRLREIAPMEYNALAMYVLNIGMSDAGYKIAYGVESERYADLDSSGIREEVVSDAFGTVMGDKGRFAELVKDNRKLGEKLRDLIHDLIIAIQRALNPKNRAKLTELQRKTFQEVLNDYKGMEDVLNDALRNTAEIVKGRGEASDVKTESEVVEKDVKVHELPKHSRAWVDSHLKALDEKYSEDASLDKDTLVERYKAIVSIWDELGGELNSEFLKKWNKKVGKDRTFSIFKAQSGYKYNVELSSMCKKGIPLFEAIDTIVKEEVMQKLKTNTIGKAEKEILYGVLKEHGFEIPCAICYVEQARQREGAVIKAFLDGDITYKKSGKVDKYKLGWNSTLLEIQKEMKNLGVDYTFPKLNRSISTDAYTPADLSMDERTQNAYFEALKKVANKEIKRYNAEKKKNKPLVNKVDAKSIAEVFKGNLPHNLVMFKTMFLEPESRFLIDSDLLYSSMTTLNLASMHNGLYTLFNMQGGTSGYKTKQGTVVYWGDILNKKWKSEDVRKAGGVRSQSNSDFMMYTALDYAQMLVDYTAKGYYLQEYTKVLADVKVFGLSNVKRNMSFIPAVHKFKNADGTVNEEKTRENAGLDENGNLLFDDIEGIPHEEALMLVSDDEYSKNNAGVCIGYSDEQILKLLDDNRFQLIIGFHDKTDNPDARYAGARYAKNYNGENEATSKSNGETKHINFNTFIKKAEGKFRNKDTITYNGKTYQYNDIPRLATELYLEDCNTKKLNPAYSTGKTDFSTHPNYYKLLADFGLYDINGNYAPHNKVEFYVPDTVPYLDENGNKAYEKTEDYMKRELEKELKVRDDISAAMADTSEHGIIPQFINRVNEHYENKSKQSRSWRDDGKSADEYLKELSEKYGTIPKGEKPKRAIELPTQTEDGKYVGRTIRTILESGITPEIIVPTIQELVADGEFSFDRYTNKEAIQDADDYIEQNGWDDSLKAWTDDSKKGKGSARHVAIGWALYNNAATSGDTKTALDILDTIATNQHNYAQAVQATRILKKLSPTAQLYAAQRKTKKLTQELNERYDRKRRKSDKQNEEVVHGARRGRNEVAERFKSDFGANPDDPFVKQVGDELSRQLAMRQKSQENRRTVFQEITSQLKKFAMEKMPKKAITEKTSAVDILRDYIQNQDFYAEAWQIAQENIREQFADSEAFAEFINSGIGVDGTGALQNAIMMKALVQSALDSGETKDIIRKQSALGFTKIVDSIAGDLISKTGAKGVMAETIRDATYNYVYDVVTTGKKLDEEIVDTAIKSALKDIGTTISETVLSNKGESVTKLIISKLTNKYGIGITEATNTANIISERFSEMCRTYAQNRLESMFKEKSPKNRKTIPEQIELLASLGAFDMDSKFNALATEKIFKQGFDIKLNETLVDKFMKATNETDRRKALVEIYRDIGRQMPSTLRDKLNAWRYISMLFNSSTHIRNIFGNLIFAPIVTTKNLFATGIESAVSFVTRGKFNRTKGFSKNFGKLIKAAWNDYGFVEDIISGGGKAEDVVLANKEIQKGRKIFQSKALKVVEALRKFNSEALDVEDMWFSKPHYAFALAQYCASNRISEADIQSHNLPPEAYAYAILEAQKATFRDLNALSAMISKRANENGKWRGAAIAVNTLVDSQLPFRKTPANILARGIEYSPIGFVVGIKKALVDVKRGKISGADAIDRISAGLTGSGLIVLGIILAANGLVRGYGDDDEKEKEFKEMMGHQDYALELPDGTSVTLDWMAPAAIPFFLGVNMYESYSSAQEEDREFKMEDLLGAVSRLSDPLLEMSLLQSLNNTVESMGYAMQNGDNFISSMVSSALTSYVSSAIPTIGGKFERLGEDVRYTTYTDKNKWITKDMQYALGKMSSKIPVWDYGQIPYIDAWGRTESTGNVGERIFNNFINPAYASKIEESDMEKELLRLYDATGESAVFPKRADKKITISEHTETIGGVERVVPKEEKDLNAREYVKYATAKGQTSRKLCDDVVKLDAYKNASNEVKVKIIKEIYDYANQTAKKSVAPRFKTEDWVIECQSAKGNVSESTFIAMKILANEIDSIKDDDGDTITNSKSLLVADMIYNTKGLSLSQQQTLISALVTSKEVQKMNKALVERKLKRMR